MRIIEGFKLRTVLGEYVVVGEGVKQMNYNKLISMNETAAMLWQSVEDKDFSDEDLVRLLLDNYEVDEETARKDVAELIQKWTEQGLVI